MLLASAALRRGQPRLRRLQLALGSSSLAPPRPAASAPAPARWCRNYTECTTMLLENVQTRCYRMYTHVVTGCTLTLLLDVQKLKMYKLKMYKTGNVQPRATEYTENWKCTNVKMYKLEMYKIWKCTTTCYRMYNHVLPNVQKKSFSKPINMGSSFEDLDARISNMKTVRNLDQRF